MIVYIGALVGHIPAMELKLEHKNVLVTAGSKGIGLATASGFHKCGAKVDILVNNAGGPPPGLFVDLSDEDWDKAVELTLKSVIRATRLVLPHMRAQKWGRIINISSTGVKQPVPGLTLSNSIRMAVLGWAKTLANQVAADNVLVNTVCPGFTQTDRIAQIFEQQSAASGKSIEEISATLAAQIPMQRIGQPEEIANLAVFLGSEAASYMTGTSIQVDGGSVQGF